LEGQLICTPFQAVTLRLYWPLAPAILETDHARLLVDEDAHNGTIMYLHKLVKNYIMFMLNYSAVEVILYLHNIIQQFS